MQYQFISIYSSDFLILMLLEVLVFLYFSVSVLELNKFFKVNNVIRLISIDLNSAFAGEQNRLTERKDYIIPHILSCKYSIRDSGFRLG